MCTVSVAKSTDRPVGMGGEVTDEYAMWDADNHLYEADPEAFTRFLPERRRRDVYWTTTERGHRKLVLGGKVWSYVTNPTFDPVAVAGSLEAMFSGAASKDQVLADGFRTTEPLAAHPEYCDPAARLDMMDHQGVEGALMYPTLASGIEPYTIADLDLQRDLLTAFNRWLGEHWGFARTERIYTTPMISLSSPEHALGEIRTALDTGCRAIYLRPAPVMTEFGMRSPADPMFDDVWALCSQAHLLVCVHLGESGYVRYTGDFTGRYERVHADKTAFEHVATHGRAISDFVTAMATQGAFHRHPELRVLSVENGSDWLPELGRRLATYYGRYPGSFPEHPLEAIERNLWVSPYWEDSIADLLDYVPSEHILAGSDFPHPEGLADPRQFVNALHDQPPDTQRRIMRDNLRELLLSR